MTPSPADAAASPPSSSDESTSGARLSGWVLLAVVLTFLASSAIRRPAPSVNEPHYLGKAKHYWNPDWCAGDLFLESSNPHRVFYQTVGILTKFLTLRQTAWGGRVVALGCLAWGWTRLLAHLLPGRWSPLVAAWMFLLLQSFGNFSGEWLVGGVESKVFAYAFAFAGLASGMDRRPVAAGIWLGLAISFHPLVGLWCIIAAVLGTAGCLVISPATWADSPGSWNRPRLGIGLTVMVLCALPGLLPALSVLSGVDPEIAARADRLLVGTRLAHHLDPMRFPLSAYRYYLMQLVLVLLLWRMTKPTRMRTWFACFVGAAVAIAVIGVLVGAGPRPIQTMPLADLRVWLLKFYPFRLADLTVPVLTAVAVVAAYDGSVRRGDLTGRHQTAAMMFVAAAFILSLILPTPDRNPSRMSDKARADWIAACRWIRESTPRDALLYAANEDWAVKWFTYRPEYVNYKDVPQDAEGIIEWARRIRQVRDWAGEVFADGRCSKEELARLHARTGITHLTASRLGPIDAEPVYRNGTFRVYAIAP